MKRQRRGAIRFLIAAALSTPLLAAAQEYPARPVKLVVPFSAGSSADLIARMFAERLGVRFRQPFIVDNKSGAGGTIGVAAVAHAPADGYTLLFASSSPLVVSPVLDKSVTYNVERDLTPIALIGYTPLLLVAKSDFPAANLAELVALLKASPGKYSYASNGNGSNSHMAMELFKQATGIELTHVPYRGPTQAETDVLGGQVNLMFDSATTGMGFVKAGRLRAYGVSSAKPDPATPDQMPIAQHGIEALKSFEVIGWAGMLAPHDTPQPIVISLNRAIQQLLADPDFTAQLVVRNLTPFPPMKLDDTKVRIRADAARWTKVIGTANIKLD